MTGDAIDEARQRATRYADLDRHAEAARILREALRAHPRDPDLLALLSFVLRRDGEFDEALSAAETGLAWHPDVAGLWHQYGWALNCLGRHDEAITAVESGLAADPHDRGLLRDLPELLHHADRHAEAVAAYREALKVFPDDAELLGDLGECLMLVDDYVEAHRALTAALAVNPDNAGFQWSLSKAQMYFFQARASLVSLSASARLEPDYTLRCEHARFTLPWPVRYAYHCLCWVLPVLAVLGIAAGPGWPRWTVTGALAALLAYSAHWFVRGGAVAWRALFRLPGPALAVTGLGFAAGYGSAAAVLLGLWLPSPPVSIAAAATSLLVWVCVAVEWSLDPRNDFDVPLPRRTLEHLGGTLKQDLGVLRQWRDRRRLRRIRRGGSVLSACYRPSLRSASIPPAHPIEEETSRGRLRPTCQHEDGQAHRRRECQ